MNANYIYQIFKITDEKNLPDLTLGLAHLQFEEKQAIPEGMTDKGIREFIARHYDHLVKAYQTGSQEIFEETVAKCVAEDEE